MARIRLYVDQPLGSRQTVAASREQSHYLIGVMRLSVGDQVFLFNGIDGEWSAAISVVSKRGVFLECAEQTRAQDNPPDLWLCCAPIRKERMSIMVEKAVELGAAKIVLMQTEFTQDAKRVRLDKLNAIAVEAAEQCEATYVPSVLGVQKFDTVMRGWEPDRCIMFCDEKLAGQDTQLQPDRDEGPWAIFIGPEGGFSETERTSLAALKNTYAVSLGPRILRAETAAIAALALWQTHFGDW